ncbi:MAG: ATP-binding protein [Fibrobacterota bacterium]
MENQILTYTSKFLNIFIFSVGIIFLAFQAKTKYYRELTIRGIWIIFCAVFVAADLFIILPGNNLLINISAVKFQHSLILFIGTFILWDILIITGRENKRIVKYFFAVSLLFSLFIGSDHFMTLGADHSKQAFPGPLYFPYLVFLFSATAYNIFLLLKAYSTFSKFKVVSKKKQVLFFLLGYSSIFVTGTFDTLKTVGALPFFAFPFTLIGFLFFALCGCFILFNDIIAVHMSLKTVLLNLKEAYAELEKTRPLQEIGKKVRHINHDIKNYCCIISSNAAIISQKFRDTEIQEKSRTIIKTSKTLSELSKGLVDYSTGGTNPVFRKINLKTLIMETIDVSRSMVKADFVLNWSCPDEWLLGDWGKLERVLLNIFKNAFDARREKQDKINITINAKIRSGSFILNIIDNGKGFQENTEEEIFTPFFTTKGSSGTGLGLTISSNILAQHNGTIEARDLKMKEGNSGAEFILTLPVYKEEMDRGGGGGGDRRGLLITDNNKLINKSDALFNAQSETCFCSSSIDEAVTVIKNKSVSYILCDSRMLEKADKNLLDLLEKSQSFLINSDKSGEMWVLNYNNEIKMGKLSGRIINRILDSLRNSAQKRYFPPDLNFS